MRKKRLILNTLSPFILQITTLVCGFILPVLFLRVYGSAVNGLINSITQFLSVISFLELGVGAVVQSALYKPLADHDEKTVSKLMVSANKFFHRLALILVIYVFCLVIVYPRLINDEFSYFYTAFLIVAISISSFAQYYFGIVNALLLNADQRGYIQYNAQTITIILNTVVCSIMILMGGTIQLVKLSTSLIYLLRPVAMHIYVNRKYKIDWKIQYTEEPIQQKWNGIAQHVAAVVLNSTDSIVLTMMSTLSNVSIYSVYNMVVYGVKQLFLSMTNGVQALMGELLAKNEIKALNEFFRWVEWSIHTGVVFVFGCTTVLVVPFAQIYTLGINDANYVQPLFGALLALAHAGHCLRLPYNLMILAGGHYKQTQRNYVIAAVVNIVVSIATVKAWGLIGVAIGTLVAMFYQTIWMAKYISKNLICWPFKFFLKQMVVDVLVFAISYFISAHIRIKMLNYFAWFCMAFKVAAVWGIVIVGVNMIFYRSNVYALLGRIKMLLKK